VIWRQLLAETAVEVGERPAARWLCEVASGADRIDDVLEEAVTVRMVAHLDAMLARYRAGEPLAYVLGRWGFRNLDLAVDRRVLIPRPETEVVAGAAIELARTLPEPIVVADLGTGSGAIGLSLADELPIDGVTVWLTDVSPDAVDVARANTAGIGRRGANVRIATGSWFDALPPGTKLDLAVANPPYVAERSGQLDEAVRRWEPHTALFAGEDGLRDIRAIVAAAPRHVRDGGWLVLEIGADQGAAVERLLLDADYADVSIRPDLTGRDRVAVGRVASPRHPSVEGHRSAEGAFSRPPTLG
jgi:release factor glutamine methyltransferase